MTQPAVSEESQHARYATALVGVADAVILTDAQGLVVFMNPAAQAMTGWASADAIGQPLTRVFLHVDTALGETEQGVSPGGQGSAPPVVFGTLLDKRGLHLAIEYTESSALDGDGRFVGTVVVARDITGRRAAESAFLASEKSLLANADALFEEKERAQVTLNSIGDAVISTDFRGKVTYLNIVAEKMTGWTQIEASGQVLGEVFPLVDATTRERIACPTTRAIIENHTVALEVACILVRRNGTELAVESSAAPIHDRNGGVIGAVMVAHDVTAARELSSRLARLAWHDSLTDLPNRALFRERLAQATVRARDAGHSVALLYIDLDGFKQTNDSLGHNVGDLVLQNVARRLLDCVRSTDTVSRLGGDEFVMVLADVSRATDVVVCAEKIVQALNEPLRIGELELNVTASIGIAVFPTDAANDEMLLRYADMAMYQAKYAGRRNYKFFRPAMRLNGQ